MHSELDRLLALYERGALTRRQLLAAVAALAAGPAAVSGAAPSWAHSLRAPRTLPRARTLNHVTLSVADVGRSRAFYERLLGVRGRLEGADACVFTLENGFFMLDGYVNEAGGAAAHPRGIDHVCVGLDVYRPKETLAAVQRELPDAGAHLEGDQLYVRDPDGASIQLCPADYKR